MTCRELVEFLDHYVADALPAERRALFDAHLAECPSCVAYLKTYRAAIQIGAAALGRTEDPVPAGVPEDLVRAILATSRRS